MKFHFSDLKTVLSRRRFLKTGLAAVAAIALAGFGAGTSVYAQSANKEHWVGTWATAPVTQVPSATNEVNNQTLRQIVHISVGGDRVRVKFSNLFGTSPLVIGGAAIGVRDTGAAIVAGSSQTLTFLGSSSAIIQPGAVIFSDPASLSVPTLTDLAIDLYLPNDTLASTSPITTHTAAFQTNYASSTGNFVGATVLPVASTRTSWLFLTGVDVSGGPTRIGGAVATLGDSITDGTRSTTDTNSRWPNFLAARLATRSNIPMGVLDVGIAGNRVISGGTGDSAQIRFDRDVLAQAEVTHLIVLEGINDSSNTVFQADQIIFGLYEIVQRAHARGIWVLGCTLTPAGSTGIREANRQAVNQWIRTSGVFDAVIDFDVVTRDPANPSFFLPAYDSGDHLHPNDTGYQAMGNAVDLNLIKVF
jgi:lysophospholipase L1-like esterase